MINRTTVIVTHRLSTVRNANTIVQKKCEVPVRAGIKEGLLGGAGYGFSILCLYSVYTISFYAGAQLVESGKVTFAEAFRIFYGVSLTATVISQSGGLVPDSTEAKTGASSIVALFDRQSKIDSSNNSGMTLVLIQVSFSCRNYTRMRVKLLVKQLEVSEQWFLSLQKRSFYAGARLIESREVTFAEVLQVFYGLVFTVNTLYRSIDLVPDSTKAKTGASSIFALLDRKSKIDSSDNSRMTLDNLKENIEFQHVSFNYPSRP
ncbi:hypothetical protein P3S68_004663 [Capsicum galapagoense]